MANASLLKPELYAARDARDSSPEAGEPCLLKGGRCDCGHVFFPMQYYGCENCGAGAPHLYPHELEGRGTLVAATRVHLHNGPGREAPFVVCSVRLAEGPMVRSLLDHPADAALPAPGSAVEARLQAVSGGEALLDLRFCVREAEA